MTMRCVLLAQGRGGRALICQLRLLFFLCILRPSGGFEELRCAFVRWLEEADVGDLELNAAHYLADTGLAFLRWQRQPGLARQGSGGALV